MVKVAAKTPIRWIETNDAYWHLFEAGIAFGITHGEYQESRNTDEWREAFKNALERSGLKFKINPIPKRLMDPRVKKNKPN